MDLYLSKYTILLDTQFYLMIIDIAHANEFIPLIYANNSPHDTQGGKSFIFTTSNFVVDGNHLCHST